MHHVVSRRLTVLAAFAIAAVQLAVFASAVPARADDTAITGIVRTASGGTVPGARVTASGAVTASATTDAAGAFTIAVSPGVYHVTVTKIGYLQASASDITVVAGQSVPLTVTISEASLSTLRTIGSVTARGALGGATINTGASNQGYVSGAEFAQSANPQINDVLQRIPDVVVQKLGTQPDQSIVVGGLQPYETQVLIDGHPIALGQYGVWLSQYFPSYFLGGVETQSGPGNTTPFANIAVGGTVNLQTLGFTKKPNVNFTIGDDNYGSQFSTFTASGSTGKLDYVVGLGSQGSNGYYFNKTECDVYYSDYTNGGPNSAGSAGEVAFCGNMSGSLWTRGQLYKLRYDFSPTTSFDVGFVGSYGGYSPQGAAWASSFGPTLVEQCIAASYECTNPNNLNLVGKTINGFYWFPGTNIWSTQQLYTANLRTSIGSATLLVRPYLGAIQPETYDGLGEGTYPSFFAPPANYVGPGLPYPGPASVLPPGTTLPPDNFVNPLPNPNAFEAGVAGSTPPAIGCPPGNIYAGSQLNSPQNTIVSVTGVNGPQEECFQYPYSTYENDQLYGSTFSLVQPIQSGSGFLDLTYDFHGQSTYAFINNPSNVAVPQGSAARFSTLSLTGSVAPAAKLAVNFGVYSTVWTLAGEAYDDFGNPTGTIQRVAAHTDPHVAFVFRPAASTSIRASWGTSETFPFVGDVSGALLYQPPAFLYSGGTYTFKNPGLLPEYSSAFDIGADHRFGNGAVLSVDLQQTIVHNVFQQIATTASYENGAYIVGYFNPINVALLQANLATLKYTYAPAHGFGFNLAATADSSQFSGIPAADFNSIPGLPANNVQVCGTGTFTPGLATCIPYLKGYAQFNYTWRKGGFVGLGVDYEGKNNAYYQPPFAIADLSVKQPLTKDFDLGFSVQNLLNTNSYSYLTAPGLGVPAVADYTDANGKIQQGSYPPYEIPAATRTLRFWIRAHIGK